MGTTFVTNRKGEKISVILPLKRYKRLLEAAEELEDIKLYDAVKAKREYRITLEEYIRRRKKKSGAKTIK